jgi:hypothetical protein
MKNVFYLSALVLQIKFKKNVNVKIKIILKTKCQKKMNGYPRCHMTHKFSQSHFRIQTRSQRRPCTGQGLRRGPRTGQGSDRVLVRD